MNAIVFAQTGGPEVLALADVPRPEARAGWVLIKNHAIGVNFADTRFRQGTYTVKPKLPDTPGMEVAGVIEAVGDGVTNLRPGMRVAAFTSRAYAEYCVSPAFMAIPLPDSLSFVDGAAFLIQGLTAYHALHTMDTTGPGKSVLVHAAAGGVGLAAIQLAKAAGARVFGTVSSDAKAGLAKEAGADAVINYVKDKFADEVLRLTGDRGVDLILDAVGKPTFEEGLRCLAAFGHIVLRTRGRRAGSAEPLGPLPEIAEGERALAADPDEGLSREDAGKRRAVLRAHARGPAQALHQQDVSPGAGGAGASPSRVAGVDG